MITAKEYLSQYKDIDNEIKSLNDDIIKLRELSVKTSGNMDGMPHSANGKTEASYVSIINKIIDIERERNKKISELLTLKLQIETAISKIDNIQYRTLLRYRYICCYSWIKISRKIGYSESHIKNCLHSKALSLFKIPET